MVCITMARSELNLFDIWHHQNVLPLTRDFRWGKTLASLQDPQCMSACGKALARLQDPECMSTEDMTFTCCQAGMMGLHLPNPEAQLGKLRQETVQDDEQEFGHHCGTKPSARCASHAG